MVHSSICHGSQDIGQLIIENRKAWLRSFDVVYSHVLYVQLYTSLHLTITFVSYSVSSTQLEDCVLVMNCSTLCLARHGMFLIACVCLCVCLFVCSQDYGKTVKLRS